MPRLIVGIGTGRCGTLSLAHVLRQQPQAFVTHELVVDGSRWMALPRWDSKPEVFLRCFDALKQRYAVRARNVVGDVSFFWLKGVAPLLERDGDARVVGLIREKKEVVESYLRKVAPYLRCWRKGNNSPSEFRDCYPHYEVADDVSALSRYWDEYNNLMGTLSSTWPNRVRVWSLDTLNNEASMAEILDFVGVPRALQRPIAGTRLNRTRT